MSFLEDMAGKELSSMLSNSSNPMASTVMQMINNQPGGISGLLQQFHDKGLGGLVSSWVGTGTKSSHLRGPDSACAGKRTGEGTCGQSRNFA